ncbi:MAG: lysophospholipid acyltransferase family protein [Verrucomicrobiales bacterium]|nr:lysophospholipid acyltransferase family protein [Verrucomicrobiales bacterium]
MKPEKPADLSFKTWLVGKLFAMVLRLLSFTLRIHVDDRCGILKKQPSQGLIWALWHNQIMVMPWLYRKHFSNRAGAVLSSASKDGAVLSETLRNFGISSVRGSSSRRGAQAMVELMRWVRGGRDVVLTPDGPRGPCYRLQPGVIKLAQKTGADIFPLLMDFQNCWELKSWDSFRIPKPFSKVVITLGPYESIKSDLDAEEFEQERLRIEKVLSGK